MAPPDFAAKSLDLRHKKPVALVWFRKNLRFQDNQTLQIALQRYPCLIPVFIWDPEEIIGEASRWWLYRSLADFQKEFSRERKKLIFRKGDPCKILCCLVRETKARSIFYDRSYEPGQREKDAILEKELTRLGVSCVSVNDSLLFESSQIRNKQGNPYKIFTAFWNACLSLPDPSLAVAPLVKWQATARCPKSERLADWDLFPKGKWVHKLDCCWKPGSQHAPRVLKRFLKKGLYRYPIDRDRPSVHGTSRLSPYLHYGEMSVRRIWHKVRQQAASHRKAGNHRAAEVFLRQLVWREFAHYLLFHFPDIEQQPFKKEFKNSCWKKNSKFLCAWQRGKTGYPIVDAGMRELCETGWMHNRVRMIVASFLTKDLLQPWQAGARWFMNSLVDADLANNVFGWQWVAGCGADAAPYFRIFNPVLQGEKFDSQGEYVRRWVPELSKVPSRWIHYPWTAPLEVLAKAGVQLGNDYPFPIVDHEGARKRALFIYDRMRKSRF